MLSLQSVESINFSVFDSGLDQIESYLATSSADEIATGRWSLRRGPLDLESVQLGHPHAGGVIPMEAVFYVPKNATARCRSVLVANNADGWMTLVNVTCTALKANCVRIKIAGQRATYPMNAMSVYEHGKEVRHVHAMLDDPKWVFYQRGDLLAFEDEDCYRKRRIRDRLTPEHLLEYLRRLDVHVEPADFWQSEISAVYFREVR